MILTVGHSNHDLERFLQLLSDCKVSTLVDVRSSPYSGRFPWFNRRDLASAIDNAQMTYHFLGDCVGGRPEDPTVLDEEGRVDYDKVILTDYFQRGLAHILEASQDNTIALMCAEGDPLQCHRGLMIAPALVARGILPGHIRRNGTIETTEEMENRLLVLTGRDRLTKGLFATTLTPEDRKAEITAAYKEVAKKAAAKPGRSHSEEPSG